VPNRASKIYVAIDLDGIGDKLGVDAEIMPVINLTTRMLIEGRRVTP
jgi:hypothetical protein